MHEILFRGKRTNNGEWVYGFPFAYQARLVVEGIETWDGKRYRIDPSTVGQYTGLTDRNGKRIFEGDVVAYREYGGRPTYDWPCTACIDQAGVRTKFRPKELV